MSCGTSTVALHTREALVARRGPLSPAAPARTPTTGHARPTSTVRDTFEKKPVAAPPPSAAVDADEDRGVAELVREALNKGGDALQRLVEDNAVAGRLGAFLDKHVAPAVDEVGAKLDDHVTNRTLRKSSFLVGTGLRLNIPGVNINGGVWTTAYVPSVELAKDKGGASKAVYVNYGADVESPLGGLGWGRRGKAAAVVNLFFLTASFDEKQQIVFIGIPGIFGVTLGKDVERGSYATFQNAVPLTPLLWFGPLWTQSFELYSPLLDPINDRVVRPVAQAITKAVGAVTGVVDKAVRAVKGWLRGDDVGPAPRTEPA
jgi:hypothetical protein